MQPWSFLHICDMQPGSPRSFRFQKRFLENWQTAYGQLQGLTDADLLLVGGDLTRDGSIHDFELETAKRELDALPYPYYAIPGNMDTCNKHTDRNGGTGREDTRLNMTAGQLDTFSKYFGDFPWSFTHKNTRFSGFYAAVAGSGLRHEQRMWEWLEKELPGLPKKEYHVMTMHYTLFVEAPHEPAWDITRADEYHDWYFSINPPHRQRIFDAFKKTGVDIVLSGHIHCRRPPQTVDGIRFYRCAGIAMPQWADRWPDGDATLGFYRFDVTDDGIRETFVPLSSESKSVEGYGPGGHPKPEERDYSLAWEK
ncbi:MAG: metallophosphoesterase [bacterium]|jgi:3',5'-cyclic AMP phosphodiesterase CpdA|nr:metallophosphoesterase [bacterium]